VFVILSHARRRVVHFNVTANPTADWTAQQIVEAFPWDTAPRYLLRDRDSRGKDRRHPSRCVTGIRNRTVPIWHSSVACLTAPRARWYLSQS
jgi:hypothetical protein